MTGVQTCALPILQKFIEFLQENFEKNNKVYKWDENLEKYVEVDTFDMMIASKNDNLFLDFK